MKTTAKKISPEDFILSALSSEDRLDAAFGVAREAFKKTRLTFKDIDGAVKKYGGNSTKKVGSSLIPA